MNKEISILYLDADGVLKAQSENGLTIPYCRAGAQSDKVHSDSADLLNKLFLKAEKSNIDLRLIWSASAGDRWTFKLLNAGFLFPDKCGVKNPVNGKCVTQTTDRHLGNRSAEIVLTNGFLEYLGYTISGYVAIDDEPSLLSHIKEKHKVIVKHPPNDCIGKVDDVYVPNQDILNSSEYFLNHKSITEAFRKLNSRSSSVYEEKNHNDI